MKSQSESVKILYVITQGFWGGAQRYVFDLATSLPPEYEVAVAVGEPAGPQDLQESLKKASNWPILPLRHLVRAIHPIHDLWAIFELRKLYVQGGFQVVHLNSSKAGIIGSLAALGLKNKPKIIYTVHGWVFLEPLTYPIRSLYRFLEKITARFKDQIIVLSAKEKRLGLGLQIPESKLTVIPSGITIPNFYTTVEARAKIKTFANFKTPKYWVGTIANLYLTKGLDILIKAAATIVTKKPEVHFFIIGTGAEKNNLEKLIEKLNLNNHVHLLGAVPDAAKYLKAFDLFVLPSRKEGRPYTLSEAMTAGLPIIATAVGGVSELLSTYPNTILSIPNNVSALTYALDTSLKQSPRTKKSVTVRTVTEMVRDTTQLY